LGRGETLGTEEMFLRSGKRSEKGTGWGAGRWAPQGKTAPSGHTMGAKEDQVAALKQ